MVEPAVEQWTCGRCEMTISWMQGSTPELPSTWTKQKGVLYCLACRRDLAEEAGLEAAPTDLPNAERQRVRSSARIEFEVQRTPDLPDNRIARACRSSTAAVRKARARLGMAERPPEPPG